MCKIIEKYLIRKKIDFDKNIEYLLIPSVYAGSKK